MSSSGSELSSDESLEGLVSEIGTDAKLPGASRRLHHLDWLRGVMIGFAVFCHIWQTLQDPAVPDYHDDIGLRQKNEVNELEAWQFRILEYGRQFCLPILFYVSGAAMALGKGSLGLFFLKIGAITLYGLAQNFLIFQLGPRDQLCSFANRAEPRCQEGVVLDFLIAPNAGSVFPVVFQFWYTLFLMLFIAEDFVLYSEMRKTYARQRVGYHYLLLRYILVAGLYVFGIGGTLPRIEVCLFLVLEAMFLVCVVFSAQAAGQATSEAPSALARLWQYAAAVVAVFQFGLPSFEVVTFDAKLVTYYHLFRQLMALGFVATLTRKTTAPVASRLWPLMLIAMLVIAPSSSFYRAGMITYPWFPHLVDRLLWLGGSFGIPMVLDRVGRLAGDLDLDLEMPEFLGNAALMMYVTHPLFIVVLAPVPQISPASLTISTTTFCTGVTGLVAYRRSLSRHEGRGLIALYGGIFGLVVFCVGILAQVGFGIDIMGLFGLSCFAIGFYMAAVSPMPGAKTS